MTRALDFSTRAIAHERQLPALSYTSVSHSLPQGVQTYCFDCPAADSAEAIIKMDKSIARIEGSSITPTMSDSLFNIPCSKTRFNTIFPVPQPLRALRWG